MADQIDKIRSQDDYFELYNLATIIRNQKLLTDAEMNSLNRHKQETKDNEIKLLTQAWQSSYWNTVGRQLKNQALNPAITCRLLKEISQTQALPAYKHFGHHFSNLDSLLTILYNEPQSVAEILNNIDRNDSSQNDQIIQVFFQLVYSSGLYPEDELRLSQVICYLLKLQLIKSSSKMRIMLRKETAMSTRFYKQFVEVMHPTMVFLSKALRKGVLDVIQLGNFWLDIDSKQSATRFLRDNKQNENRLPEYRALVVSKLVSFVDTFLENISEALPMLPSNLNWIIRNIFCSLYEVVDDLSAIELSHACKDMIVSHLLCPAIISPQKYGIVDNDVKIGTIAYHNLTQIAMIIQVISLQEFETPPDEYSEFLTQCRKTHLISEMMDALLIEELAPDVEIISLIANETAQSDLTKKTSFVGTVADVNVLMTAIRSTSFDENLNVERISSLVNKLPNNFVSNVQKNTQENSEASPKTSTLRNIHRKVQHSFKKTADTPDDLTLDALDLQILDKENFDLFFSEYSIENYKKYEPVPKPKERTSPKKEEKKEETFPEPSNVQKTEELLINFNDETSSSEKTEEIKPLEQSSPPLQSQIPLPEEHQGNTNISGFAKLKNLGDRMKKGISQSSTLSDIRGQLRRSSSIIKQSGMTSSNSEQTLNKPPSGPRDDILAKYAASPASKEQKTLTSSIIPSNSSSSTLKTTSPYYNSSDIVSCRAFQDTLRKLVTVLGNVSYIPRIGYRNKQEKHLTNKKQLLHAFLEGVLVETEHRREYGQAAQVREVQRCIEMFENDGVEILIQHLKVNEKEQESVINGIQEERALLMKKSNDIFSLEQRVLINRQLTEQLLVDHLARVFLETGFQGGKNATGNKTAEVLAVLKFYDEFKTLLAHDERAEFLQNLLSFLKERLLLNVDWTFATNIMVERAITTIERYVMFSVYETAFYPNREVDQHKDKLLRGTIATVGQGMTATSEFLKLPEHLQGEAPWPSAQAELSMLDVYVTAQDKLKCVVRCCDVINNLVALSSKNAVASADDLTPVLVFVIIKANPRALLSNLQFIETFAGHRLNSGRDAYYWTIFKSAVEYIKTIL